MSNEKFTFGGVSGWAGGPGWGSCITVVEKVSRKLRLHFSFNFFDMICFVIHSLETIPLVLWV